jgi:hypothetical protein
MNPLNHLTEEELVAQAYGENGGAVEHMAGCSDCARAFAELKSDLAELKPVEPPARDENYGERVWQAIAGSLEPYARNRNWLAARWPGSWAWRLAYAAACTLLVAGAFYAGRVWEHVSHQRAMAELRKHQPQTKQPIVVVVLSDHLDRSERLLVELKHVDANNTDMLPPLRDEARTLLQANRVCQKNAEKSGDPALEATLDRLDHVLAELANQPGGLNAAAIERLKEEMNADGLLFEVRVLRSRVQDGKTGIGNRSSGGAI